MGLYGRYLLPRIIHLACGAEQIARQREKVVPGATGRVLEVGMGSGLNLPYYDATRVTGVVGLEPSPEMARLGAEAVGAAPFEVEVVEGSAEEIPLESGAFDTVVLTYTLCSIPEPVRAVREMARTLAPGGRLLFCEHGLAPDERVRRWQRRVNPLWKRVGGGCNLDRDIPALLREGGFDVQDLETMYIPGWRPASFNYWGAAVPKR